MGQGEQWGVQIDGAGGAVGGGGGGGEGTGQTKGRSASRLNISKRNKSSTKSHSSTNPLNGSRASPSYVRVTA